MNLYNPLKIALDIDDTILDFWKAYKEKFPNSVDPISVTKNVRKLRKDREFWEDLEVLERPNFEPHIYSTKRINSKQFTINCLRKHNLPIKPIYQMYYQHGNKADMIRGRCDILVDDSLINVVKAINSGLPALIIDRPHNQTDEPLFRIYSLDIDEIIFAYKLELETLGWN